MDITIILSMAAVLISLVGLLLNGRKDTRTDAATSARVEARAASNTHRLDALGKRQQHPPDSGN